MKKLQPEVLRQHKGKSFVGVTTSFMCHDGRGKFFLARRSNLARDEHGRWDMGGGGLKWNWTAEENVRREIMEEYSTKPLKIEFLGYRDIFREQNAQQTHWLSLDFLVLVDPKEVKIVEPDIFEDSGWFSLDNLPSPLHSQLPFALNKYKKQLA